MAEDVLADAIPAGLTRLLPWHHDLWRDVWGRVQDKRLPHAMLLRGPEGLGKQYFAHYLALSLLCHQNGEEGAPCGYCKACELNRSSTHPDLISLTIEPERKSISIDQIRELIEALSLKSQYGHGKVVIVSPADALNNNAANSLLKTLEEPHDDTVILLCTSKPASLPATIRSRCQLLHFQSPDLAISKPWLSQRLPNEDIDLLLRLAAGAPLRAIKQLNDGLTMIREHLLNDLESLVFNRGNPTIITEHWLKLGVKESLYSLYSWTVDMIRLSQVSEPALLENPDIKQRLIRLSTQKDQKRLFHYLDKTAQIIRLLDEPLNQQLMLEDILLDWSK